MIVRWKKTWNLALVLALLAGCVSRDEMSREFADNRQASYQHLRQAAAEPNSSISQEVISGPLSLDQAVNLAWKHNKNVQLARLNLLTAKGRIYEAVATALPTLNTNGSALDYDTSSTNSINEIYSLGTTLKQPLYLGGQIGAALDAATAYQLLVEQQLRQALQQAALQVKQQYYNALLAQDLVRVQQESLRNSNELLRDATARQRYGAATRFDVLRAQVQANATQAQLIKRQNDSQLAVAQLLNAIGVAQLSQVLLTDKLTFEPVEVAGDTCLLEGMRHRPELLIGEANIRLFRDNLKSVRAGYQPKIYAQAGIVEQKTSFSGPSASFSGTSDFKWTTNAGLTLEWNFSPLQTYGQEVQAKTQVKQQQVLLRQTEQQVQLEIQQALFTVINSKTFVLSQQGNVDNAQEALRLAQVSFREGAGTSLDVIAQESALVTAQSDLSTAIYAYQVALLNLSAAVGTLGEAPIPCVNPETSPVAVPLPPLTTPSMEVLNEGVEVK